MMECASRGPVNGIEVNKSKQTKTTRKKSKNKNKKRRLRVNVGMDNIPSLGDVRIEQIPPIEVVCSQPPSVGQVTSPCVGRRT